MTMRIATSVLGVLMGLTCAAVAVAQTVPDCQALSNQQFQAAHDQYEREVRACDKVPACLQDSYNRWITASNKARQAGTNCTKLQSIPLSGLKTDTTGTPSPAPPPAAGPLQGSASHSETRTPYPEPKMLPGGTNTSAGRQRLQTGTNTNAMNSGYKVGRQDIETPVSRQPDHVVVRIYDSDADGKVIDKNIRQEASGQAVPRYWTGIRGVVRRSQQQGALDAFEVTALSHKGVWTQVPTPLYIKLCPPSTTCAP